MKVPSNILAANFKEGDMEQRCKGNLSVGNALIDADHINLLSIANRVVRAIELADLSAMAKAFDLFDDRLRAHFENEENIALAVKFPFAMHKLAQNHCLKELDLLKEELLARGGLSCNESIKHYSDSLRGLLFEHIIRTDMLMKPSLQSCPYNFYPAGPSVASVGSA